MDIPFYLDQFQKAADRLDKSKFHKSDIEIAVGVVLDSVFLKLYKKAWATSLQNPLTATSRVFFSVWVNDASIEKQKLFYNIHALKLRQLKGYTIESRKFAALFRQGFKKFEPAWENVRVDQGPLTLMEGWLKLNSESLQNDIIKLANNFLVIEHLVDGCFTRFRS